MSKIDPSRLLVKLGLGLVVGSLLMLFLIFKQVIWHELVFLVSSSKSDQVVVALNQSDSVPTDQSQPDKIMVPVDTDFGIIIPKIGANARVVDAVNPYDSQEYQSALALGVAHAKGSAHPGSLSDVFLFAHSSADFFRASQYNSIFYLIHKLKPGDKIYLTFEQKLFEYQVTGQKIVKDTDVSYLDQNHADKTLTLMTCWPPGTTLNRLLVTAKQISP